MPGINQLKKFIENISSIGDEQNVRAQRGELYIPYSLPTGLKDVEDADSSCAYAACAVMLRTGGILYGDAGIPAR